MTNASLGGATTEHPHQHQGGVSTDAHLVPGFPQDMFMAMDEMVDKPETRGLRPSWTGGVMGMMTLVRVLEPSLYDQIQDEIESTRTEVE